MSVFTTPMTVRFRDLDSMGHVNHAVFLTYFEEGRKGFFIEFYETWDPNFAFIMAHIGCDYLRPVKLIDKLILQLWVMEIGTKSFTLGYKLINALDEAIVYAKGESVQVCYDYAQSKSREVPEVLRQKLAAYQVLES